MYDTTYNVDIVLLTGESILLALVMLQLVGMAVCMLREMEDQVMNILDIV